MSGAAQNPNEGTAMQARLRWQKLGKLRFTSHRDMARIWERALRQAQLPVAYTQGFSPRAKLAYGLALPTTFESVAEFIDVSFKTTDLDIETIVDRVNPNLPVGVEATGCARLEKGTTSLQQAVTSSTWLLTVSDEAEAVRAWIDDVLSAPEIQVTRERKGKQVTDDLRPAILSLATADSVDEVSATDPTRVCIVAELGMQPRALRPSELLGIFEPTFTFVRGRRQHQWIASDGARREPVSVGAAAAPHRELCAT